MKKLQLALAAALALSLVSACTKKRERIEGQFADPQVVGKSIDLYKDQSFKLVTGKVRYEVSRSSADNFVNENNGENFIDHPVVDYTVEYPEGMPHLLGRDVRFRGIPNGHTYEIQTKIVRDKLWVNKVGSLEEIPTDEITLADRLADGRYSVPLVTYNIAFFRRELVKNADNEDTNVYSYKPLSPEDQGAATHIRIDEMSGELAQPLIKTDTFKADYFEGEWFYAMTVVQAQNDSSLKWQQGISFDGLDTSLQPATRVKFLRTGNSLQVVNVNVDERLLNASQDKDTDLEFDQVMTIPASLYDYRRLVNDKGIPQAREEQHQERKIQEREWIKLDLGNATTLNDFFTARWTALLQGSRKLTDLRVADDFWSFTVLAKDSGAKIRYSFYKVNSALSKNYKPRNYIMDDRDYFGFFATKKSFIRNYEQYTEKDIEKYFFVQRFNPEDKVIEFHMSHGMAQSPLAIELAKDALKYWDKAFELAGTGIRIKLNTETTVDLGDLRYNVLNIIDRVASGDMSGGGLLFGVGPSISDPKTGEVVSVSNTLHVDSFRAVAVSQVRNFILDRAGILGRVQAELGQNFSVPVPAKTSQMLSPELIFGAAELDASAKDWKLKPLELHVNSATNPRGLEKVKLEFNSELVDPALKGKLEAMTGTPITTQSQFMDAYKRFGKALVSGGLLMSSRSSFDTELKQNNRNSFAKIEKVCPEVIEYAEELGKRNTRAVGESTESNPIVLACANRLIKDLAMSTLVHELGHNFGLAHNFASSNDAKNFWTREEVKDIYGLDLHEHNLSDDALKSASVMEYMPSSRDEMFIPGKYDIAAIRYAYTGTVVSKSSGLPVRIQDTSRSLEENFGRDMADVQTYRYCDDFDAAIGHDPLCIKHDFGSTPTEVAGNLIADYYDSLLYRSYRYGRETLTGGDWQGLFRFLRTMIPLKRIYDEWRFHLADFMADGNLYLSQISVDQFNSKLNDMSQHSQYKEIYNQWFPARDMIRNFLVDVATLPNHYCVGVTKDNEVLPVEIDELIDRIKRYDASERVETCEDKIVQDTLRSDYGAEFVMELGFSPEDRRFSLRAKDEVEPLDYSGVRADRLLAVETMGMRLVLSLAHMNRGFAPNMFDEPDFRGDLAQKLVLRSIGGVDLTKPLLQRLEQIVKERSGGEFKTQAIAGQSVVQQTATYMSSGYLTDAEKKVVEFISSVAAKQTSDPQNTAGSVELRYPKFKRESMVAMLQHLTFVQGQMVPGEQYETRVRLSPFMASESGNPDYLNQQGIVKAQLPNGSYITAFQSQNPIAALMVNQFSVVNSRLGLALLKPEDFAVASQIIEQVVTVIPAKDSDAFTAKVLADLVEHPRFGLMVIFQNGQVPAGAKQVLSSIFGFEIQVYQQQMAQALAQMREAIEKGSPEDKTKATEELKKLMETDIKGFYQQQKKPLPSKESVLSRTESLRANSEEVRTNQDEYEAQRDLLLQILTSL